MRYSSRKFLLAVWAMALLTLIEVRELWTASHWMAAGLWLTGLGTVLGLYKAATIMDDKLNGRHDTPTLQESEHDR